MTPMSQTVASPRYIKAGPQMKTQMKFGVSHGADLPDADVSTNDDNRQIFKACENAIQKVDFKVPVWFAVVVVAITCVIMLAQYSSCLTAISQIDAAIVQTMEERGRVDREMSLLQADFDKACDSSYICYYAAQKLGMKRAVDDLVIQISAPDTRPVQLDKNLVMLSASGNH